jgi:hypothetical protein
MISKADRKVGSLYTDFRGHIDICKTAITWPNAMGTFISLTIGATVGVFDKGDIIAWQNVFPFKRWVKKATSLQKRLLIDFLFSHEEIINRIQ